MANVLGEAWVEISAPLTRLGRDLTRAQGMVDRSAGVMGSRMGRLGATMSSIGTKMTLGVTVPLMAELGICIKRASEAETAIVNLDNALKANGAYSKAASKDLNKFAEQVMNLTVYDDEAVKSGLSLAIGLKGNADRIKEVTWAGVGLAHMFGLDLPTAMTITARGSEGIAIRLMRFGILLKKGTSDAEVWAAVSSKGAKGVAGAVDYATNTAEGNFKQMQNAIGEAQEAVGGGLLPEVKKLTKAITELAHMLKEMKPATRTKGIYAALGIGPTLLGLGQIATWLTLWRIGSKVGGAAAGHAGLAGGGSWREIRRLVPGLSKLMPTPAVLGIGAATSIGTGIGMMGYSAYGMAHGAKAEWKRTMAEYPAVAPKGMLGKTGSPFTKGSTLDIEWQKRRAASPTAEKGAGITKDQGDKIIKALENIHKKTGTWG